MTNGPCPSCGHQKAIVSPDCCVSCGHELTRVFDGDFTSKQYANALEVSLAGGYGTFFDNMLPQSIIVVSTSTAASSGSVQRSAPLGPVMVSPSGGSSPR